MADAPRSIEFVEVGPRDGLQNEARLVSTAEKLGLIARALDAGIRRIEVASFVNPKKVPQMADGEAVCAGLPVRGDVTYIGLVLNERGAERAIATGRIDQLGAVCAVSETFAGANQGMSSDGTVKSAKAIIAMGKAAGITAQATIATSFGCPFEGETSEDRVVAIASELAEAGPVEIAIADTIGVGDPARAYRLVARIKALIDPLPVRVHFHNTRNTGLANVWTSIIAGASVVDASIGGLGGCPFAAGAAGNVPSEDVIYMLERAGISTGVDLPRLIDAGHWLAGVMEKELPTMVGRAGGFPIGSNNG